MSSAVRCLTASLCCAQANVLSTMAQSLVITCVVSVLWMALGYSLTFAEGNAFYGGASRFWLMNVFDNRVGTLPEVLFCMYQMTFAIICVAIITGSFAERMRFGPMIIFSGLWHLLVYCPIAHWEWGPGGFLHYAGVLDFADGDVIHISSGVAGLASTLIIGKRKIVKENHNEPPPPHNVMLVYLGGAILWVGWFGFNAGSAVAANQSAAMAMLVRVCSRCSRLVRACQCGSMRHSVRQALRPARRDVCRVSLARPPARARALTHTLAGNAHLSVHSGHLVDDDRVADQEEALRAGSRERRRIGAGGGDAR